MKNKISNHLNDAKSKVQNVENLHIYIISIIIAGFIILVGNIVYNIYKNAQPVTFAEIMIPICGNASIETDEQCDDGNQSNGDGCSSRCLLEEDGTAFIFVTSTTYFGNIGGIAEADAICNSRAQAAGLDGQWMALLSDTQINAEVRLPDMPFVRMDWAPIADNKTDLLDGNIRNPILITEYGNSYTEYREHSGMAWTGSFADGTHATDLTQYEDLACLDWISTATPDRAIAGLNSATNANWINGMHENEEAVSCDRQLALYCYSSTTTGPTRPAGGYCGDNKINKQDEECDGTDLGGIICSNIDQSWTGVASCTPGCLLDFSECGNNNSVCGNGILESGEECDDGNKSNEDGCSETCSRSSPGRGKMEGENGFK